MLWLIDSCQKGYLLTSVTNKQKQGGKGGEKKEQTREEGKKDKGAGVSLTDYKPKRYLKIYCVHAPTLWAWFSALKQQFTVHLGTFCSAPNSILQQTFWPEFRGFKKVKFLQSLTSADP